MRHNYIAWVLVGSGDRSPQSVLIRQDGSTEPPNYHIPSHANVNVQMLVREKDLGVEVRGDRFVVRDRARAES